MESEPIRELAQAGNLVGPKGLQIVSVSLRWKYSRWRKSMGFEYSFFRNLIRCIVRQIRAIIGCIQLRSTVGILHTREV